MRVHIYMQTTTVAQSGPGEPGWRRVRSFDTYAFGPMVDENEHFPNPAVSKSNYRFERRYGSEVYLTADVEDAQFVRLPRGRWVLEVVGFAGFLTPDEVADLIRREVPGFARTTGRIPVPPAVPAAGCRGVKKARVQQAAFGW